MQARQQRTGARKRRQESGPARGARHLNILLLAVNLSMILASAVIVLALTRRTGIADHLLGIYVLAFADIVLVLELAGLLSAVGVYAVMALQALVLACVLLLWFQRGRPALLVPLARANLRGWWSRWRVIFRQPLLLLLAAAVGLVYLRHAQMVLVLPVDSFDSLAYHLSRVGYWLQYGSYYPWPTAQLHQTIFPMNSELAVLWTILWWGTDQLAGFTQWIAVPAIMLAIYGLVRLLGYSATRGAYAALLWTTLTQVIFQSWTAQNDLVISSFFAATVYFFLSGLQRDSSAALILSGISFGLAIGTKGTSFFMLPPLAIIVIVVCWLRWRQPAFRHKMILWALTCASAILLLGSYSYVQNVLAFGHPFGPPWFFEHHSGGGQDGFADQIAHRAMLLQDNAARYLYQLVDFSPLPLEVRSIIRPYRLAIFDRLYSGLGIDVENPDTIARPTFRLNDFDSFERGHYWFGPLAVLLMPVILYEGYRGLRTRDPVRIALAVIPVGFLLAHSATQGWTDSKGRYYLIPVSLAMPLMATLIGSTSRWRQALTGFITIIALVVMQNVTRVIESRYAISWNALFAERHIPLFDDTFGGRMIKENVAPEASIAVSSVRGFIDFPLFDGRFTRRVTLWVPDDMTASLPRRDLQPFLRDFEGSDFLYAPQALSTFAEGAAERSFLLLGRRGSESLWIRKGRHPADACDTDRWPFSRLVMAPSNVICPQFPISVGLDQRAENGDFAPVLEPKPEYELAFNVLVRRGTRATVSVALDPGSYKARQHLGVILESPAQGAHEFVLPFQGRSTLQVTVPLPAQTYTLRLFLPKGSRAATLLSVRLDAH